MDTFSVIADVVGVATTTVKASEALIELVDRIKSAPDEIKSIARDTNAFYLIVVSS